MRGFCEKENNRLGVMFYNKKQACLICLPKEERIPGVESGIAKVIPGADGAMEVSLHPQIALRHHRSLTSLVRVCGHVPVSRPSGRAGGKSWIRSSRGGWRASGATAGGDGAAADGGDG